jgi:hypothetical protein
MSSSSASGVRSNTKRSISWPTIASARRARRSGGILTSITARDRIRALTREPRIAPTSSTCRSSRQHEFTAASATGRGSTYPELSPVQTNPVTSICLNLETICSAPNPRLAMFSSSCWGQSSQIDRYKKAVRSGGANSIVAVKSGAARLIMINDRARVGFPECYASLSQHSGFSLERCMNILVGQSC